MRMILLFHASGIKDVCGSLIVCSVSYLHSSCLQRIRKLSCLVLFTFCPVAGLQVRIPQTHWLNVSVFQPRFCKKYIFMLISHLQNMHWLLFEKMVFSYGSPLERLAWITSSIPVFKISNFSSLTQPLLSVLCILQRSFMYRRRNIFPCAFKTTFFKRRWWHIQHD